jgi:hypothetical protein
MYAIIWIICCYTLAYAYLASALCSPQCLPIKTFSDHWHVSQVHSCPVLCLSYFLCQCWKLYVNLVGMCIMIMFSWNIFRTTSPCFSILFLAYDSTHVVFGTILRISVLVWPFYFLVSSQLVIFMFCRPGARSIGEKSNSHPEGEHTGTHQNCLTLYYYANCCSS